MATTVNPTLICYRNPNYPFLLRDNLSFSSSPTLTKFFSKPSSLSISPPTLITVKCSNNSEQGQSDGVGGDGGLKEVLSGMVDERVEELLNREENRVLLDGLEKATQRVEIAKRELAEIQKQEIEAKQLREYVNQLESRTSEIAECEKEILEARAMVEEAQRSLNIDGDDYAIIEEVETEEIDRNEERLESIKAASISALVGSLAGLPIFFTQVTDISQLILPLATTFISCALFGVTFRYAVRRDLDNFQLKTGTCAAFAFVKGVGTVDGGPPLELEIGSFLSHALIGAAYISENLLIFLFAAVALDFCYKMRVLSPFPIKKSAS
ncbi:uncharacterized protein LOC114276651 [Camellia sinensis]|uniref:Homer protein n=1 Tax=Camellia sinensis var. sinensis TaxID=542762 RepID=A0A4V3WNG8_CAMSN|nr:uncharacterized protein LOC114276651 [Camellia sinensis]THG12487.1 hypothetical protein TEA_022992 [Camellia sinensis var. sinensis]